MLVGMARLDRKEYLAGVSAEIARLAEVAEGKDMAALVPACPEWDLGKLVRHTGMVHRWATHIVRTRATERVPFKEIPMGLPADRADLPAWLDAGAEPLVAELSADPETAVWTWAGEAGGTVGWWARRMLHESTVHRADADLTLGLDPDIAGEVAADGIEELLENLAAVRAKTAPVAELGRAGDSLHLHATDGPEDGSGEWTITLEPDGFSWAVGHTKATVAVRGAVADLELLLYNRRNLLDTERYEIFGDTGLAERWLAATAL